MNYLTAAELCDQILFSILGNEDLVGRWWHSKNKAFDMQAPAEVNVIEVLAYLEQFSK